MYLELSSQGTPVLKASGNYQALLLTLGANADCDTQGYPTPRTRKPGVFICQGLSAMYLLRIALGGEGSIRSLASSLPRALVEQALLPEPLAHSYASVPETRRHAQWQLGGGLCDDAERQSKPARRPQPPQRWVPNMESSSYILAGDLLLYTEWSVI